MSEVQETKNCWKCKTIKPKANFHRNRSKFDGLSDTCKSCERARLAVYAKTKKGRQSKLRQVKKYQATDKGKETIKAYLASEEARAKARARVQRYQARCPEKTLARNAVTHAKTSGDLPYADTLKCQHCGSQARDYHHHLGYSLEHHLHVIPLCRKCHASQKPE